MTDFRALCKELTDALAEWELGGSPPEDTADAELVARARAALAATEPEPPADYRALITELVELAKRPHYQCEDSWYSCPMSQDGCANDAAEGCDCGANDHNAKVGVIATLLLQRKIDTPDTGEVAELVEWLRNEANQHAVSWPEASSKATRLADFVERLAPVPPTDEELISPIMWMLEQCVYDNDKGEIAQSLRELIARWGTPNLAQVRSSLGDRPQPVPEGPAVDDIEALHQAVFASWLYRSPPSTTIEVDFARAVLARWGRQ